MPVFKCFFKIINKNKGMVITYIVMFMALVLIISATAGWEPAVDYSASSLSVAVVDRDGGEMSKALSGYMGEQHKLTELPDNTEALQDALFYRDVEYILIIPSGFEAAFAADPDSASLENVELPGSSSGVYIDNQIDRYLATVKAYLSADFELSQAISRTADDLRLGTTVEMYGGQQETTKSSYYFFQYLAYILTALIISALGPILIAFNKRDLRQRMESSSLKLRERNTQVALGCITTAFSIWAIFMLIALLVYREDMLTAASALQVINSLVFLIVCVSISFMLGQFLKKTATLGAINNAVTLGMSFLCGVFVPQWLLGEGVLSASKFLPAYWYVRSNDMLSVVTELSSSDMRMYGEGIVIQLGFAAAIFAVALVVSRQRKQNAAISGSRVSNAQTASE